MNWPFRRKHEETPEQRLERLVHETYYRQDIVQYREKRRAGKLGWARKRAGA